TFATEPGQEMLVLYAVDVVVATEFVVLPELRIALTAKPIAPVSHTFHWNQQAIQTENGLIAALKRQVVLLRHDDRFFRAHLFAVPAEDATQHVDLEPYGLTLLDVLHLVRLHGDSHRRAHAGAEVTGDAPGAAILF